jgi:hypothetical protein
MLERIVDDVWVAHRPLRFFGVEVGTKMTVVRLRSGSLFVHSPIALDAPLREAIDALGPVVAIVAPSLFHHLFVGEWAQAYPRAALYACPGLEKKRKDIGWSHVLGEEPETEWSGELDQVFFGARAMENEIVFFHRSSKTIVSCDLIFNLGTHPSGLTRTIARLVGSKGPGTTVLERLTIRDRAAAREQVGRIVDWGAERIVIAHGDIVPANGSATVRDAYGWL